MTMTNNPTIDGVRKLAEQACGTATDSLAYKRFIEAMNPTLLLDLTAAPVVERQPVASQVPVLRAMAANYRNGHSWDFLDGEAVGKAADEITVLQSTIAKLQARVQELESGRGEPVAYISEASLSFIQKRKDEVNTSWRLNLATHVSGYETEPLYKAPPAPVALVLPDRKPDEWRGTSALFARGWNACLDATAALNEVRK